VSTGELFQMLTTHSVKNEERAVIWVTLVVLEIRNSVVVTLM